MKKNLSIIIVHWNTPNSLRTLLTLLKNSIDYQIIVVDNASDKKLNWLKEDFPSVEFIHNKLNRGYAYACNQGVVKAGGEWLLFLNPDVEIMPEQINAMIEFAEKTELHACSIKSRDNSYQKPLPTWLSLLIEFTPMNRFISLDLFKNKTLVGGCLLIKTDVFKSLGGFDERFFLWFEDSDLTFRLIQGEYKIDFYPTVINHIGGESFKKLDNQYKRDIFFNSMDIYSRKHFSLLGQLIVCLIKKRYTARKLLPTLCEDVSITVPNLKRKLLDIFLKKNSTTLSSTPGVEWIIVTSSVENKNIWEWRSRYPKVRFISIEKNKGFASSVNMGFRASTGQWLGTINDDITLTEGWLDSLLLCQSNQVGSINPVIYGLNQSIESAGIDILPKGKAIVNKKVTERCFEVQATNAAAVIYNKNVLNNIGLFDEKFGSYLEDIDLSLRIKRAGYKNIVSANSKVIHIGQSTSKDLRWKKQYYDFTNWILLILKNWSLKDLISNFPQICIERLRNISGVLKAFYNA